LPHFLREDRVHVGMQGRCWRLRWRRSDLRFEFNPALLDLLKLQLPCLVSEPVQQQFKDLLRPSIDTGELARCLGTSRTVLSPHTIDFRDKRLTEGVEGTTLKELRFEGCQHAAFKFIDANRPDIRACATHVVEALQRRAVPHAIGAATGAAFRQAAEDVDRTARRAQTRSFLLVPSECCDSLPRALLPCLCRRPQLVIDDAQVRLILHDPRRLIVQSRHPLLALGVEIKLVPIPHAPTDVSLVVENAAAASHVAVNRVRAPRRRDAVLIAIP
jgi:hypothetical protein